MKGGSQKLEKDVKITRVLSSTELSKAYNDCKGKCANSEKSFSPKTELINNCILKNPSCKAVYNDTRNPSYCDRIIYNNSRDVKTNSNLYDSNYTNVITTSDHAITYFATVLTTPGGNIKLLYITFNQAGNSYSFKDIAEIIKFTQPHNPERYKITNESYDIIILCQQETPMKEYLHTEFKNTLSNYTAIMEYKGVPKTDFYLRLSVFVKNTHDIKNKVVKAECFYKFCTKSYIGISFDLLINKQTTNHLRLNIFGTHLPIKTKMIDLGYGERLASLITILKVAKAFQKDNYFSIIGGDLNFRVNQALPDSNIEQLSFAMNTSNKYLNQRSANNSPTPLDQYFVNIVGKNKFTNQISYFSGWKEDFPGFLPSCKINNVKIIK